jgi:predicted nucleic acid-binding protein
MVLVDSSPWIDLLGGRAGAEASRLEGWLRVGAPVAISGVVLQEILQGVRSFKWPALVRGACGFQTSSPTGEPLPTSPCRSSAC